MFSLKYCWAPQQTLTIPSVEQRGNWLEAQVIRVEQGEHDEDPARAKVPARQTWHVDAEPAPTALEDLPAGHAAQTALEVPPVEP